jgi:hypothetical protein
MTLIRAGLFMVLLGIVTLLVPYVPANATIGHTARLFFLVGWMSGSFVYGVIFPFPRKEGKP